MREKDQEGEGLSCRQARSWVSAGQQGCPRLAFAVGMGGVTLGLSLIRTPCACLGRGEGSEPFPHGWGAALRQALRILPSRLMRPYCTTPSTSCPCATSGPRR